MKKHAWLEVTIDYVVMGICWGGLLGWMFNVVIHQMATSLAIVQSVNN